MIPSSVLIKAYSTGYFPMGEEGNVISWHSPDPRTIIPLDKYNIPRSTKQIIRTNQFEIRIDSAFETVIRSCARRSETWITDEIIESYLELRRLGLAHSVESVDSSGVVGGLYGVALGSAFFGESMFSLKTGGSKVALAFLIKHLVERGFTLLNVQYTTPHLRTFGSVEIPRKEYLGLLSSAMRHVAKFVD